MACVGRKTEVELSAAKSSIEHLIGSTITLFDSISGGEQSQAFQFTTVDGKKRLVRFRDSELPFQKDRLAFELFSNRGIPIPRVHTIERMSDSLWVCISDFCEGRGIDCLDKAEYQQLHSNLFEMHLFIQSADIGALKNALVSIGPDCDVGSWKDALSKITSTESHDWDLLIRNNYISVAQFEALSSSLLQLLNELGDYNYCVHGDLGFNNVLAQDGKITAILDWEALTIGDFVYDLAWLDFWPSPTTHKDSFYPKYQEQGLDVTDFDKRLMAYTIALGLDSLAVHGRYDDVDGCKWILNRLMDVSG